MFRDTVTSHPMIQGSHSKGEVNDGDMYVLEKTNGITESKKKAIEEIANDSPVLTPHSSAIDNPRTPMLVNDKAVAIHNKDMTSSQDIITGTAMEFNPPEEIKEKFLSDIDLLVKHANRTIGQGREMIGWLRVLENEFGISLIKNRTKLEQGFNELVQVDLLKTKESTDDGEKEEMNDNNNGNKGESSGGIIDLDGDEDIDEGEFTYANILQRNKSSKRKLRRWKQAALEAMNEINNSIKRTSIFEMTPGVLKEAVKEYRALSTELERQKQIANLLESEKTKLEEENENQKSLIRDLLSNVNGIRIPVESNISENTCEVNYQFCNTNRLGALYNFNCGCGANSPSDDYRSPSPPSTRPKKTLNSNSVYSDMEASVLVQDEQDQSHMQQALQHQQAQALNSTQKVEDINHHHHQPSNDLETNNCHNTTSSDQRERQNPRNFIFKALTFGLITSFILIKKKK